MYHIVVGDGPVCPVSNNIWANPTLLTLFAKRDKIDLYYLCVKKGETIKAIMPIFQNKRYGLRYTYQPILYKYTPIDFFLEPSPNIFHTQNEQLEILTCIAKYLRANFKKVSLAFESSLSDLRAFKSAGFKVEPQYTFTKDISGYIPSEHPRILRRSLKEGIEYGVYTKEIWDIAMLQGLCLSFISRKSEWNMRFNAQLFAFLEELHKEGLCTAVVAFVGDTPLAFRVLLKDSLNCKLYDMLAGANETGEKYGANAHCLEYIFTHFTEYNHFDFCGANIPKIAFFKSQFNCELVHYFAVRGWFLT